jgi:diguanylate cyclase (GGDEF)-like protein/PAS domain S-box-containing protein
MSTWSAVTAHLIPHGYCLSWQPGLMAMHLGADAVTAAAYATIPILLIQLVRRRKDLQFSWVFVLFGVFILACGATHLMSMWTLWHPDYLAAGLVKMLTAIVSVGTAAALYWLLPKAIALPGPAQWAAVHENLRQQVAERSKAEHELTRANAQLQAELLERQRTAAQLQLAANVFDNAMDGIVVTDASSRIHSVNPAFTTLTGYTAEEAVGQKLSLLRSEQNGLNFYREQWNKLLQSGRWTGEVWSQRKNGELFCQWLNFSKVHGTGDEGALYVGIFNDVTDLRRKDEHIRHLAFHDLLTGLPNRTLLLDRLAHAIEGALRQGEQLGLMFLDLDRFKQVNDTLGHDVGDELLKVIAARLRTELRESDTAARMGGDEFIVLIEHVREPADLARVASKLIASLSQPVQIGAHTVDVGATIGIACYPQDGLDGNELMRRADAAMYAAKAQGRGRHGFFSEGMGEQGRPPREPGQG